MDRDEALTIMRKRKIDPSDPKGAAAIIADMSGGRRAQARVALNWLQRNPAPAPKKKKAKAKPKPAKS